VSPEKRGFALLSPEKLREITSRGGRASTSRPFTDRKLAKSAGKLGGKRARQKERSQHG
jgi:general stress protein YciG